MRRLPSGETSDEHRREGAPPGWRAALAIALVGFLGFFLTVAPASAQAPGRLASQITDPTGAFGNQTAQVQAALDKLDQAKGLQLWVAYVASFDGLSGSTWAARTADASGLGGNDLLFAVAINDRAYGYSAAEQGPSDSQIQSAITKYVEPKLAAEQWAASAIALADGLRGSSGGSSGSTSLLPWLVGGAALLGVGGLLLTRGRRGGAQPQGKPAGGAVPPPAVAEADLRKQAAAALIDADDSLKTSEQELGFAIAQFGEDQAKPFSDALEESRAELKAAFALQQKLDDAVADTPADRIAWLHEIIQRCQSADQRLDDQVAAFDKLRALERDVDKILPGLQRRAAALGARISTAQATVDTLAAQFPPAATKLISDNLVEASHRLNFAATAVQKGTELLTGGDRNSAVANARAAEEALGQADQLLASIERAPSDLAQSQAAISALLVETDKDVAEAERLGTSGELAPVVQHARETLAWARQVTSAGNYDPLTTRRALQEADNALESALGPARDAAAARARAAGLLKSAADSAVASIQAAQDFITTRRGGVGAEARTRLAEAQRRYTAAVPLADSEPERTLKEIQAADALADQALALAQRDESDYQNRLNSRGGMGGGLGGLGNIVLGGILIDALTGGRRGGGGFPFPGGFPMPGGGGAGPGSFGGAGTRGRRSGGGRF